MNPPGTASEISPQEAKDLLAKFATEATRLQAAFLGPDGISFGAMGILSLASSTQMVVKRDGPPDAPFLAFSPGRATGFRYAAGRAIPVVPIHQGAGFRPVSTLIVDFANDAHVFLIELSDDVHGTAQ